MRADDLNTVTWKRSSYSKASGGNCVEVPADWRKSSYSNESGGNCVEVAGGVPGIVPVRDSKAPEGSALAIPADAWRVFVRSL